MGKKRRRKLVPNGMNWSRLQFGSLVLSPIFPGENGCFTWMPLPLHCTVYSDHDDDDGGDVGSLVGLVLNKLNPSVMLVLVE